MWRTLQLQTGRHWSRGSGKTKQRGQRQ